MEKKYIMTDETIEHFGHTLHRIQAVKNLAGVSAGMFGGYIEREDNLEHAGNAWVYDTAMVYGNAIVYGNARVSGNAIVYGNARVSATAMVSGNAAVHGPSDIALVKGFGSEFRTTSFFKCSDGKIRTCCGCFYGTLDEFREQVKKTHGESKFAREYLIIADLMEMHFREEQ